jgi:hypothetical protein
MQGKLLYIGTPDTTPEPVIQISNGSKAIITSIRLCAPTNSNGSFDMYHLHLGETTINTNEAIAFNFPINSKTAVEFLTHPLPVSPGESIWVGADDVSVAIYGVTFP